MVAKINKNSLMLVYLFILIFVSSNGQKNGPKEVVFIISGSDEFGGHGDKWFNKPIRDIISLTSQYFPANITNFAVIWTIPTHNKPSYQIVSSMQNRTTRLKWQVDQWLNKSVLVGPIHSKWTGLRGSIEFAKNHLFSKDETTDKIVIALTHMNIDSKEIDLFIGRKCTKILVNVVVFPWPWLDCQYDLMQKVLKHLNKKIGWSGYFLHDLAICGRELKKIRQIPRIADVELPNLKRAFTDFCIPTTPTTTIPTTTVDEIEQILGGNDTEPENTTTSSTTPTTTPVYVYTFVYLPPCKALWCQKWLFQFYFLESVAVILMPILLILTIWCQIYYRTRKRRKRHSIKRALIAHYNVFTPQFRRIGFEMKIEPPPKKMKRRGSKGSIASRKSVAKVKSGKEHIDERKKKKEATASKMGSTAFSEEG